MRFAPKLLFALLTLVCSSNPGCAGIMTYMVTLHSEACREVHLGTLALPPEASFLSSGVSTGYCRPEVRSAGETTLYLGAACISPDWFLSPTKYAVGLSGRRGTRKISDAEWQAATELPWSGADRGALPREGDPGIPYAGVMLHRSGPRWAGVHYGQLPAAVFSRGLSRAAVNSWDGFDITYSFLDPTSLFRRDRVVGRYWIDIYETASGKPLVRINGSFHRAEPFQFQYSEAWYSERYFVMPVGRTNGNGNFSMRQLLICDLDAAARKGETVLKERRQP